jgi:hypothetical protein
MAEIMILRLKKKISATGVTQHGHSTPASEPVEKEDGPSAGVKPYDKKPATFTAKEAKDEMPVTLRLPPNVLREIDQAVAARKIKIPRHTWLLEAVAEKLDRQG